MLTLAGGGIAAWLHNRPTPARLRVLDGGDFDTEWGVTMRTKPKEPVSIGGIMVCLDRPGRIEVTGLAFMDTGGVTLRRAAIRQIDTTRRAGLGADRLDLAHAGFPPTAVATATCGKKPEQPLTELAFEVVNTSPRTVKSRDLLISYCSGHSNQTFKIPVQVILCAPTDETGDCTTVPGAVSD